jgi:hypothetical protein
MESGEQRGWVKPLEGESAMPVDAASLERGSKRSSLLVGAILAVLIAAAVAGTVLWRGRNGDPFGSARALPANMDFVVTFDALELSDSARLQRFVDAFAGPMYDAGVIAEPPGDIVAAIDRTIDEGVGMTLSDDILPWIGRSVSIAGTVPDVASSIVDEPAFDIIVSAEVRDDAAAQAFVEKVVQLAADMGETVTRIGDDPLTYRFGRDGFGAEALVLTDDYVLFGLEDTVVAAEETIDGGPSLADSGTFRDTMDRLPSDRMVSVYLSGDTIGDLASLGAIGAIGAPVAQTPQPDIGGMGAAAGLNDDGILLSYVVIGDDVGISEVGPDSDVVAALGDDTLGFVSSGGVLADQQPITRTFEDLGLPLEDFEMQFGVDVADLLESLSGEITIAATETREGAIARETDVPIGVVGAIGLTDPDPIGTLLDRLPGLLAQGGWQVSDNGDTTSLVVDGNEVVSYALEDDLVVVGTGSALVGDVAGRGSGGLVDGELYRRLDDALTGDGLVGYFNVPRVVDLFPLTQDEQAVLEPLRGVGIGAEVDGDASLVEVLVLVDY